MTPPVYLDHAATTPLRRVALDAYVAVSGRTGNAASLHGPGRAARRVLEDARDSLAASLGCDSDEVVITSGGTESDNIAVHGLFASRHAADPRRRRVLLSAVEHPAVMASAQALRSQGAVVVGVGVDGDGAVDPATVSALLAAGGGPGTVALVACMWANNEVGTIQPVAAITAIAAQHGIPVHVDAVQAAGVLDIAGSGAGAATLAMSGHKVGGPVGSGVLVLRRGTAVTPLTHGGGQEVGLRPGTVAVGAAAAVAAALSQAVAARAEEAPRLSGLRDMLESGVAERVSGVTRSGPADPRWRLPGIAHLTFDGCDSEALLMLLDRAGIAASTGSACRSGVLEPSPVLIAMGMSHAAARGAVRFSLGHTTTTADIRQVLDVIGEVVMTARAAPSDAAMAGQARIAVAA